MASSNHYDVIIIGGRAGDALHQKDPIDGQGIYDALFEAKALASAISSWKNGTKSWEEAMQEYESTVRDETFPMYRETLSQVKSTVYTEPPLWLDKLLYRWLGVDDEINARYGLLTVRGVHPKQWLPVSVLMRGNAWCCQ